MRKHALNKAIHLAERLRRIHPGRESQGNMADTAGGITQQQQI